MIINGREFDFTHQTFIAGILNVTPDSFSDGGRFLAREKAIAHAASMIEEGADIIDIGGESTRPGSEPVPEEEEIRRVVPVIEELSAKNKAVISIDTTKASVAKKALDAGAHIINDISGLRNDELMAKIASDQAVPICIMHMKGTPKTMQKAPHYNDVIKEINDFFAERLAFCDKNGISRDKIILDPGIGFGKRLEDNLTILNKLGEFKKLGCPILIGTSRKSFIGAILEKEDPDERLYGTLGSVAMSVLNGASIVRVHDVKPVKEMIRVMGAIRQERRGDSFCT